MSYESWRISYQSSEAAARAAYATTEKLHAELTALREQMAAIGAGGVEPLRKQAAPVALAVPMAEAWEQSAADTEHQRTGAGLHFNQGVAEGLRICAKDLRASLAATPAAGELATLQAGLQAAAPAVLPEPAAWLATFRPKGMLSSHSIAGANFEELKRSVPSDSVFKPLYTLPADGVPTQTETLRAELAEETEAAENWRRLAMQFDHHRLQALGHLKAILHPDSGVDEYKTAELFLKAPPLDGESVLAQRIAKLSAAATQAQEDAPVGFAWSGWACMYPGKLPRLYGALEIASVNLDAANGDQLIHLSTSPGPQAQADARDVERWMGIGKAIERACADLPEETEIIVSLEKDAGTVTLIDQDGNEHENFSCDYGFAGVLNEAIDAALAAQAKQEVLP